MEKDLSCQVTNWREYRRLQVKECGWSRQKPARRAAQRDEEAIRRWKEERWPQVKKGYRGAADYGIRRPVWALLAASGAADLRPSAA